MERGTVLFSADFEMAWAFRYSKTLGSKAVEMGMLERKNVPTLIELFDHYRIPCTWATVGHLFLDKCSRDGSGRSHADMIRPGFFENRNWSFLSGDWYEHDPGGDLSTDPAWYASDLVERIVSAKVVHEIACHSFSHLDFTYGNCPKSLADSELDACIRLAKNKGISLKSMIFPGGTFGNFESLKERGFVCYRRPMKYHIDLPRVDEHQMVVIPSSLGLDRDPYGWSREFHLKIIRKFIEKAAKKRLVCNFWFHPSLDPWYLETVLPEALKMIADQRDERILGTSTMAQLAREILNPGSGQ